MGVSKQITRLRARRIVAQALNRQAFTVDDLRQFCFERTGRTVVLVPFPVAEVEDRPSGFLLRARNNVDYVFYDHRTGSWRATLIICHELAHILLNHSCAMTEVLDDQMLAAWFPSLSPELLKNALKRTDYDTTTEHGAEYLATKLLILTLLDDLDYKALRRSVKVICASNMIQAYGSR